MIETNYSKAPEVISVLTKLLENNKQSAQTILTSQCCRWLLIDNVTKCLYEDGSSQLANILRFSHELILSCDSASLIEHLIDEMCFNETLTDLLNAAAAG